MSWRIAFGILMLAVAACATRPAPTARAPQAGLPSSAPELAAAIKADADRSEHEADSRVRSDLAEQAEQAAQSCLALAPDSVDCLYGSALAFGLQARVHPTRASDFLGRMLDALSKAESADPTYDEAGPARVRALVLIRAPGWPLGPGDADAGLAAARRALHCARCIRLTYLPSPSPSRRPEMREALAITMRAHATRPKHFPLPPNATNGCMRLIGLCMTTERNANAT